MFKYSEQFRKCYRVRQKKERLNEKLEKIKSLERVRKVCGRDKINQGREYADYFSGDEKKRILRRTEFTD